MPAHSVPTALKILKGTAQKCRMTKNEPMPEIRELPCPEHLSAEAKKHWPKYETLLRKIGVLTEADESALEMLCESHAEWAAVTEKVNAYGFIVEVPAGLPRISPYWNIAVKAQEKLLKLLIEFGLTPSSRTKVSAVHKKEKGKFDDL